MLSSTAVPASAVDQSPPTGNNHRQRVAAVVIIVIPHSELHLRDEQLGGRRGGDRSVS